jgi:hypothetical protein
MILAGGAYGYSLKKPNGDACKKDGSDCDVYCDSGLKAGTMNWNGSVWTDGVKSDPDMNAMARKIVAANGTACQ